jgi:peroxiredoxin
MRDSAQVSDRDAAPRAAATTLQQQLEAMAAEGAKLLPAETLAALERSIADVAAGGILDRALRAGALAPSFTLPNARGRSVALADLLARGPLVLTFYRGIWCPYCNLALRAYQQALSEIRALGGDFAAISPQTPDNSLSTAEKNALAFEVLSDRGNAVAAQFGITYETPAVVSAITRQFGVDLAALNGSADNRLPISATYVIAQDRRIVLADIDADFRRRLEPAEAIAALHRIAATAAAK